MKGFKEITLSFTLGLLTLGTLFFLKRSLQTHERTQENEAPVVTAGDLADPALDLSWGLKAVHAQEAWRHREEGRNIVVAVIDTGCDTHHPNLEHSLWINPGESGVDERGRDRATNGIDDDGNGFVDDVHGWNFVENSTNLEDRVGHGTHIAGIIGAKKLDGMGLSGVAPRVSLMILKYYDPDNSGIKNLEATVKAIHYAVQMGADIINYSGGGILRSSREEAALKWAASKGVLVVAAAGNEGLNSDFFHFYPADYGLANVISVGAVDREGELTGFSNYGQGTVDIAAPGKNIYSTLPNGEFGYMSGTSQATAFVTGVAALLMSEQGRTHDPKAVIQRLIATATPFRSLHGRVRAGGEINAGKALSDFGPALASENVHAQRN